MARNGVEMLKYFILAFVSILDTDLDETACQCGADSFKYSVGVA